MVGGFPGFGLFRVVRVEEPGRDTGDVRADGIDFFVSHAGADQAWAEWVAWQLAEAGYTVELDVWDWAPGRNFVTAMNDALERAARVVALFSAAYFDRSRYTTEEWSAALVHVPGAKQDRVVPVRVEEVAAELVPAVLRPLMWCDVFGVDADQARRRLLDAVRGPRRPDGEPVFPGRGATGGPGRLGRSGPRLPGSVPRVWNIPARNPVFTGRDQMLVTLRDVLTRGDRAVVQALHGMGGVGKTQLAAEYAWRFAGTYELAWWVDAEQAGLIGDQFAALGADLGCVEPGAPVGAVRAAVLGELRDRGRWLLVFDNAQASEDVAGWLPGGGHVLITSRQHRWAGLAAPIEVDVLAQDESIALLTGRVSGLTEGGAAGLASELGDLPLALAQAAEYLAETGMDAAEYLRLLRTRAREILNKGRPLTYPMSLAAATGLAADHLARDDPAAAELAGLCAFLAPEPVPVDLFTGAAAELPTALAARAADPIAWRETLTQVSRHALARLDHRGLQMHRLTQAILRDRFTAEQGAATRERAEAILAASNPRDPANPATWPRWAQLMPHLLAADVAGTTNGRLRWLACSACAYLLRRGDTRSSYGLATNLYPHWRERLGDDEETVLEIAHQLARTLQMLGHYAEARGLEQDVVARARQVLGENNGSTLVYADSLAGSLRALGDARAARDLVQDIVDRRRRLLGEDHPHTLTSASNLAILLRALGEVQAARDLNQDTLDRRRRVLGADHPDTLASANNVAFGLRAVGEIQAARDLNRDTLDRRRRVLGADHPDTLHSASNLADDLRALGELQAARDLDRDTLDRYRRVLGEDHPETLRSAGNLAADRRALGEAGDGDGR
jgi:TIR domain/Tetratricopeptide repeat/NB-ARC domain